MNSIRVLVADDHRLMAEGIRALIGASFEVVGLASDGVEMIEQARSLKPDVIVADLGMPKLDGLAALERLRAEGDGPSVVVLSMRAEVAHVRRALRAGASGYVVKHAASEELSVAIRAAAAGQTFVSPALTADLLKADDAAQSDGPGVLAQLSPRQLEVLTLLVKGLTAQQVASALGIVQRTVEFHKYRIMELLGARTSADLIRISIQAGIKLD